MRVLYLTQVFETDRDPGSDRHLFFCKYLVGRGHSVTALTSNVDYKRAVTKHPEGGWRVCKEVEGVEVEYLYSYPHFRGSLARRFLYFVSYLAVTMLEGARMRKVDVVYAVSTPLTVGVLGVVLSRIHRCPLLFEVTDVWPDAAVAAGVVRNRMLIRLASWFESFCYRKAWRIVALTEGIRRNVIGKGVPAEKVLLVTNGVDSSLFRPGSDLDEASRRLRNELKWGDRIVCMYLGAHGRYNALDTIIEAACELRDDQRFVFVLVGDGDEKRRLEGRVRSLELLNVSFLPPVPRAEAPALLGSADVCLLPNRTGEFFNMNLPNKLFDFLASARPIVVAGEGESADVVRKAQAGLVVPAENARAVARALQELARLGAAGRAAMGRAGRAHVLQRYDRSMLCETLATVVEGAAA